MRDSQEIDRSIENENSSVSKKSFAILIVGVMIVSAMAMVLPSMLQNEGVAPGDSIPAKVAINDGEPEWTYTVSNMFEMYLPDFNYNRSGGITFEDLGRHQTVDGMPSWYNLRDPNFGEKIYRSTYPHIFFYGPYSTATVPEIDVGFGAWAPYRTYIVAKNVTDCHTRSGDSTTNSAIYVPDLDNSTSRLNDGTIDINFYLSYMTTAAMRAARSTSIAYGNHFARWFFSVPLGTTPLYTADDGYWSQLMAKITYSKEAAISYLGYNDSGDVRTWFSANESTLESNWFDYWVTEGSGGGWADIYTAYDFPEDIRALALRLDTLNSTADTLVIYMWCISWGMDAQLIRYMEKANITKSIFQNWMEDLYLNVSISPTMSNTTLRGTSLYHLSLWEDDDPSTWMSGWAIEAQHMDWCGNTATHLSYQSPYNIYDPEQWDGRTREERVPGTLNFGKQVSYWVAPMHHEMAEWENITVIAKATDVICFKPGASAVSSVSAMWSYLNTSQYWGTMVLSNGGNYPQATIASAYDPATKTINLQGPLNFTTNSWAWGGLKHGIPSIMFDVSPVSTYDVTSDLADDSKYTSGVTFNLYVTAKNGTGATATSWNGTVDLAANPSAGVTFGSSSLTFNGATGVVTTTMTISGASNVNVTATDSWFPSDISGWNVFVLIPEFSTLIIPVIGAIAIFFVFRTKKRREE